MTDIATTMVECNLCGEVYTIAIGYRARASHGPNKDCRGYLKPYRPPHRPVWQPNLGDAIEVACIDDTCPNPDQDDPWCRGEVIKIYKNASIGYNQTGPVYIVHLSDEHTERMIGVEDEGLTFRRPVNEHNSPSVMSQAPKGTA